MKKTVKKYQAGGATSDIKAGAKQIARGVKKGVKQVASTPKRVDDAIEKRYPNYTGKGTVYNSVKQGVKSVLGMKKYGGTVKGKKK
jgi:hypothetical protein